MHVIWDPTIIEGYLSDASNICGHAEALVRPKNAKEVSEVVSHCQQQAIPLTVTARRTSTTGGPVPQGGWLLSTERMDNIVSNTEVESGVLLGAYQSHVESCGMLFPPDPTSRHESTVGAAIACNASGARSFCYGPTRPWIEAVEVVFPTGEVQIVDRDTPIPIEWPRIGWVAPDVKTAAGYFPSTNLLDLLIGQEGTLGVITKAWTRLVSQPPGVLLLIAFFPDVASAMSFVAVARNGARRETTPQSVGALNPRAIEYFDHNSLRMVRQRVADVPKQAQSALFLEIEYQDEPPIEAWWDALVDANALVDHTIVADDDRGRRRLHEVRHAIPAGINEQVVRNQMPKLGTDFSVPDDSLTAMMESYASVTLPHVLFGHIGDNHLHLNFLPRDASELEKAKDWYRELAMKAVELGGTVSAEHGIGRIKRELLADMVGPDVIASFQSLKRTVDPAWILGRGVMFEQQ